MKIFSPLLHFLVTYSYKNNLTIVKLLIGFLMIIILLSTLLRKWFLKKLGPEGRLKVLCLTLLLFWLVFKLWMIILSTVWLACILKQSFFMTQIWGLLSLLSVNLHSQKFQWKSVAHLLPIARGAESCIPSLLDSLRIRFALNLFTCRLVKPVD